ncbi:MAG: MBL fold metallo-hydrolase [Deltaproteobacteria bacterium]|nr:MBL fold metallo-hydrolase [Deltaproteobacteria bacterium]
MKKPLVLVFFVQFIVMIFASTALAAPELKMIAPGVFALVGGEGRANSGFVVTDDGVVVIDTQGPPELAMLLREKIKETTDKPVTHVLNTHYHGDHTFGNQYFAEAVIIAHENTRRALIDKDEAHRTMFKKFFGEDSLKGFSLTLPAVTFNDRMTLRVGGRTIELVHPWPIAHTDGDIFVWLPAERVVFAGDLLYNGRLPLLNDGGTAGALKALELITLTEASVLVPGHGPVSVMGDVAGYRGFIEALRTEAGALIDRGALREEVVSQVKASGYSEWLMYKEWLPANAGKVFDELMAERKNRIEQDR